MPNSRAPAVAIRGLHVRRGGKQILSGVSLEISSGIVTGLLGPSGSGKTTLLRSIVGVQAIESGTVTVLGEQAGSPGLRRRVGYVTQAPSVYLDLTVHENLRYFASVVAAPGTATAEAISTVGLDDQADQVVRTLSGGERSRVSLASALLGRPDVSSSTSPPSASIPSSVATSGRRSMRSPNAGPPCSYRAM